MRGRERGCARRTNDAGREDSVVMKSSARETTSLLDGDMRGAGGDDDDDEDDDDERERERESWRRVANSRERFSSIDVIRRSSRG